MAISRALSLSEIDSYNHISSDLAAKVRVLETNLRIPGFYGITLGRFVIVGKGCPCDGSSTLIAHELVHVRQWFELGALGFLGSYLSDFFTGLLKMRSWRKAYRNIGLEIEARKACESWSCQISS